MTRDADRGVSELVGVVILFGIVAAAVVTLLTVGSAGKEALERQQGVETTELTFREVDGTLSSLAAENDRRTDTITLPDRPEGRANVTRNGSVRVTVNGNASCRVTVDMSTLTYRLDSGVVVAYEGSGVWSRTESGVSVVSPPGIEYRDGYARLSLVNLAGDVDDGGDTRVTVVEETSLENESMRRSLFGPRSCRKPDTISVAVTSDYYRGWERYLRDEFEGSVSAFPGNRTVVVRLNESDLPPSLSDPENALVDFGNESASAYDGNNTIVVRKNHTASMRLLGVQRRANESRLLPGADSPHDTVFVIDKSGSMGAWSGGSTRLQKARTAVKGYVAVQNQSPLDHRAGVVAYDTSATSPDPLDGDVSTDFDAVNQSTDNIPSANGGTKIEAGLERALDEMDTHGNDSHNKTIVILSDGCNSADPPCNGNGNNSLLLQRASTAASRNVTVHTVAMTGGSGNANATLMSLVASRTGGNYYDVSTAAELQNVFEDIARSTTRPRIAPAPVTANLSVDGSRHTLAPGGDVESGTVPDGTDDVNGHDPTRYDLGTIDAGSRITVNVTAWECDDYDVVDNVTHGGVTYERTECTDVEGTTTRVRPTLNAGNLTFYRDGDALPAGSDVPWYHDGIAEIAARAPDVSVDGNTLDAPENQVLVVVDLPGGQYSRAVFLYEAGQAPSEADFSYVLGLELSEVEVEE